jgi:hypothetical protein
MIRRVSIWLLIGLAGLLLAGCTRAERDPLSAFKTDDKTFSFWVLPF